MSAPVPLHTHGKVSGVCGVRLLKVVSPLEAVARDYGSDEVLIQKPGGDLHSPPSAKAPVRIEELRDQLVVSDGAVIRLREGSSLVSVLYRRGSKANTLFATERCNSLCLMCSQPPRDDDDSWRIAELLSLIPLIDPTERHLGVSGGEPTLLGDGLTEVLKAARLWLPETELHVLTNGRLFKERPAAEAWVRAGESATTWGVPLYADRPAAHDEVVAAPGAFEETLQGLYELARMQARVEIRVVLHQLTMPRLSRLAEFIYRRLPFVEHVALMGLEPMGFAKRNRDQLWIDPADYQDELRQAVFYLANRGMAVSIYNLPYCALSRDLWPFARASISDWKNSFVPDCERCAVQDFCAGFFASAGPGWRSRSLRALAIEDLAA